MMNKLLNKICIGAAVLCSASVISSCPKIRNYHPIHD